MAGVWDATVKAIRDENSRRLRSAEQSLASLKNQTSSYAEDHRKVLALRREMMAVIDRHIDESGAILPAPDEAA